MGKKGGKKGLKCQDCDNEGIRTYTIKASIWRNDVGQLEADYEMIEEIKD